MSSGISVKLKPEFQNVDDRRERRRVVALDRVEDGLLGLFVVLDAESVLADDVSRQHLADVAKASSQSTNGWS